MSMRPPLPESLEASPKRAALQAIEHDREEMERQIKDAIWSSRFVPNPEAPEAIEKRIRGRQEPMLAERKARAEAMPD